MNCISCGLETWSHRVIVTVDDHEMEGGLCSSCEVKLERIERFGQPTEDAETPTCIECDSPAKYAIPELDISVDDTGTGGKIIREFEVDTTTPLMCKAHLERFLSEPRGPDPLNMLDDQF